MELVLPNNYVDLEQEEMRCLDGGLSLHKDGGCYSKRSHCLFYGELNMFKLSDKVRVVFALLGVSSILVSMYLIPFIRTENKFWEILLFILGVLLIGIALLSHKKIKFWK